VKARTRLPFAILSKSVACAATMAALTACGSSDDPPPPAGSHVVEIFSWWTAGGEKDALDAMLKYYAKAHPDDTVINAAQQSADTAQQVLEDRIASKAYPDTFQLNAGIGLRT
jgi:glucose/mannose transport system substrate-binding protein